MYEQYHADEAILYYLFRFVFPLFMAESITFINAPRRKHWIAYFICYNVLFLVASVALPYYNINIKIGWFSVVFLLIFLLSFIPLIGTYKLKITGLLFLAFSSYTAQNLVDNLWTLIYKLTNSDNQIIAFAIYLFSYAIFYTLYYFFFVRILKDNKTVNIDNKTIILISGLSLLIVYILSMYAQHQNNGNTDVSTQIYAVLACFFLLCIQFNIFRSKKLKDDKETLEKVISFQQDKFNQSKRMNELINIKCHDLKHQIESLKNSAQLEEERKKLDDIKKQVDIYDSSISSGSPIIDMVIHEKSMTCQKEKIQLSMIIQGDKFSFIDDTDLYALFENALDNAIKAVLKEKADKRIIFINAQNRGNCLLCKIENYCSFPLTFVDGLPQTDGDTRYHGYGTKSIRYMVEKYNGLCSFKLENNHFSLTMLFPLRKEQTKSSQ